ncbi:Transcriptional activator spt7 [Pleurotus pulmonarius]|nr:Transcriptional activator spt7 [Pleurotus pulmonarius]KAF4600117.1 Transcriptional activator spt7 [Pleurotus pulmonarius]
MNNLLRTLTESRLQTAPDANLKLLLTTVKEGRRQSHDAKLADPFYESLEGLLHDLRTITIDNRDAEAFLRPVNRSEVPDYYDVISTPMDLQTMLRKVKQKTYKSKREFKDDLDLIWSNCRTYNAAENHPLQLCARRLQAKAERLLKNITDRKERTDPTIPSELPMRSKLNGVNGYSKYRSPSYRAETPRTTPSTHKRHSLKGVPFAESPAIVRTPESMATFARLDTDLDSQDATKQSAAVEQIREYASCSRLGGDSREDDFHPMDIDEIGDKRKLNGVDHRPRKRTRFTSPPLDTDDITHLWWKAAHSDELLGSGLPSIPFPSSYSLRKAKPSIASGEPPSSPTAKRRGRRKIEPDPPPPAPPKALLTLMNNNIRTMRRVRQIHSKFAALNINTSNNEDGDGVGADGPLFTIGSGPGSGGGGVIEEDLGAVGGVDVDQIDEQPWLARMRGRRKVKGGVEMGECSATDCLKWTCSKVLEHSGFQGTSREALDVLVGVTAEYFSNVGRTMRFLTDKHAHTMLPEEIILHTLFESGTSQVQDLERYISDDIERYGARITDLEKKLDGAFREVTAADQQEDEGLFEEDEEDGGALVLGNFADAFGEDFLGLRELGIAAEHNLSSLTIPKRLLKGKKGDGKSNASSAKPTEPPPPFPPPPPFIPLDSTKVESQIGLLKPYYQSRISSLSTTTFIPPLPGPVPLPLGYPASATPYGLPPLGAPPEPQPLAVITLPDDLPALAQTKMGPLGQILKAGPAAGSSKKKGKSANANANANNVVAANGMMKIEGEEALVNGTPPGEIAAAAAPAPKKKKGVLGVGSGNGRKKKFGPDGQPLGGDGAGGQGGAPMPLPAVTASA